MSLCFLKGTEREGERWAWMSEQGQVIMRPGSHGKAWRRHSHTVLPLWTGIF